MRAQEAAARLDEKAKSVPWRKGWMSRVLFEEACACQLAEGDLIHLEDLVLLDGGVLDGMASIPLTSAMHVLGCWMNGLSGDARALLFANRPGEVDRDDGIPFDVTQNDDDADRPINGQSMIDQDRLKAWQRVARQTEKLPAIVAAGIAWDAWLTLGPERHGNWRAPLLAALVMKSRGLTTTFLLPVDWGRRHATYRRKDGQDLQARLLGFMEWSRQGTVMAARELDKLALAEGVLRQRLKARRRSRLPQLVDLFLSRPLVTVPMAAKHLKVSQHAVQKMIAKLGSTPREVTGRQRFRVWRVG